MKIDFLVRQFCLVLLFITSMLLVGCMGGPYHLKGRVIAGNRESVKAYDEDDPKLQRNGLEGVEISVVIEPDRIKPESFGPVYTDDHGWFELKVDKRGAGFLEYKTQLLARRGGYDSVVKRMMLPRRKKGLLIIMRQGADSYRPPVDEIQQSLDALKHLDMEVK